MKGTLLDYTPNQFHFHLLEEGILFDELKTCHKQIDL